MGFRRFLAWLAEKLLELHLGVAALLAVKFCLPVTRAAYGSVSAFVGGVRETVAASADDAAYVAHDVFAGSWLGYGLGSYLSAIYVIGFYFYLSSLYILLSLLACAWGGRHYRLHAMAAYSLAFAFFCLRFVRVYDDDNLLAGTALFVLGLIAAGISAAFGQSLAGVPAPAPSMTGGVRLDFSR